MFHASFASAFTPDHELWHPRCLELEDHDCSTDQLPANLKLAQNLLLHLDACKSMGPNEIHPKILRELADVNMRSQLFSKGLGNLDSSQVDWKLANVPIFKKGKKEDPGSYRPNRLTSVPGKIVLGVIKKHLKGNADIGHSQHGLLRGRSCLTNFFFLVPSNSGYSMILWFMDNLIHIGK